MARFDEQNGRAVVLHVTGETVEWQVSRDLAAAAEVASWDAAKLASVSDALEAVVPGDSPALVLVTGRVRPARAGHRRVAGQAPRRRRPLLATKTSVPQRGSHGFSRATCGSWSDAWSWNSAFTCTESYSGFGFMSGSLTRI